MRVVTMEIEASSWIQNVLSVGDSTWLEKGSGKLFLNQKYGKLVFPISMLMRGEELVIYLSLLVIGGRGASVRIQLGFSLVCLYMARYKQHSISSSGIPACSFLHPITIWSLGSCTELPWLNNKFMSYKCSNSTLRGPFRHNIQGFCGKAENSRCGCFQIPWHDTISSLFLFTASLLQWLVGNAVKR